MHIKKIFFVTFIICISILLSACSAKSKKTDRSLSSRPNIILNDKTNINPVIYDTDSFYDELIEKYPNLRDIVVHDVKPNSFPIPGLIQTYSLETQGSMKPSLSKQMDPQGLAVTDDYIIVSAYSRDHKHHSVLYVLNKINGNYIKQIVLPRHSHVGGLAYDPNVKRLWVATKDDQGVPSISSIDDNTLEKDNFKKTRQPIKFNSEFQLKDFKDASYLAYHENSLFVGYFDKSKTGKLTQLPLNSERLPDLNNRIDRNFKTEKKIQGISFYKEYILFSQSYGSNDSHLLMFKDPDKTKDINLDADDVVVDLKLPPYMEQIKVVGPDCWLLFESASDRYRDKFKGFHADHVFKIGIDDLLKSKIGQNRLR